MKSLKFKLISIRIVDVPNSNHMHSTLFAGNLAALTVASWNYNNHNVGLLTSRFLGVGRPPKSQQIPLRWPWRRGIFWHNWKQVSFLQASCKGPCHWCIWVSVQSYGKDKRNFWKGDHSNKRLAKDHPKSTGWRWNLPKDHPRPWSQPTSVKSQYQSPRQEGNKEGQEREEVWQAQEEEEAERQEKEEEKLFFHIQFLAITRKKKKKRSSSSIKCCIKWRLVWFRRVWGLFSTTVAFVVVSPRRHCRSFRNVKLQECETRRVSRETMKESGTCKHT